MKFKRKNRVTQFKRLRTNDHTVQGAGIPMKCRQFPKSFWQQPNRPNKNIIEAVVDKDEIFQTRTGHIKITSAPDTNLLFSLFKILKHGNERIVESNITETTSSTTSTNNNENKKKVIADDEENLKELTCLDDPYMSPKEDCRGLKKSLRSSKNYSELLSDLVVNL